MSNQRFERAAANFGLIDPVTGAKQVATATVRGTVLRGVAVPNAAAAPTKAEFDALLASLRTAGVIAT